MADQLSSRDIDALNLVAPADDGIAVTPADGSDLSIVTRGLYLGASGDVKVTLSGGAELTFVGLTAGVIHPLRVKRVWATGTTATGIVGLR